jgi:transcriptional regulator with XRE-family HTH domain
MTAEKIAFDFIKCSSRIRSLRQAKGESHASLADSIGVSEQLLKNYEQAAIHGSEGGYRVTTVAGMSINTLCRLADHFGVTTDYLLGRTI